MVQELEKTEVWMLGEEIPDCDLFFSNVWLKCFVSDFDNHIGRAYSKILCRYEGYHLWFYFGEQDSFQVAETIVNKIINEKDYARQININIIKEADKLDKFAKTIPQKDLNKFSNEELWNIYNKHNEIHSHYYTWCWIPVAVDMFHNNLTKLLKDYLREIKVPEEKLNEYFITLTQPTSKSLIYLEQQELLKIACEKKPEKVLRLLEKHRQKYYYTKCIFVSGEYTLADYQKQLEDILNSGEDPKSILQKQALKLKAYKAKKKALFKQLKIEKRWQVIFTEFAEFMVTKIYRRYAQLRAVYQMGNILREIAKRFYLTEKQVRHMLPREVEAMLLRGEYNEAELLERTKFCVNYADKNSDQVYVGEEALKLIKELNLKEHAQVSELTGEIGCPGYAKGKVKIIIRAGDMDKMEQGDILVSIATDPDIVPAMKKAGAIVTEQGGVTSHAAIVSRELNIPCVIGTKIATRVLKDGDMVEVDANKGIVKIIK